MQGHNAPEIPQAFRRLLRLQGETSPTQVLDTVQATVEVARLWHTPYWRECKTGAVSRPQAAGGATEYSYVWCSAAEQRVLRVLRCRIANALGTVQTVTAGFLTAANIATIVAAGSANFRDFNAGQIGISTNSMASKAYNGIHTALIMNGGSFETITIPAGTTAELDFTEVLGPCLWANDPDGVGGFAIRNQTLDEGLQVYFEAEEWPLVPSGA